MEILYADDDILVCVKPARVLSTDEPGGVPDLAREALGDPGADVRTVHRLDRVVAGLMVLARNAKAASELSRQIRDNEFQKEYLAVVHGCPETASGTYRDLLGRDKARKMTFVAAEPAKGVQEAVLDYEVLGSSQGLSKVRIRLYTGRTHQIRVQFASRGMALAGERKYYEGNDPWEIALWSHKLGFTHPGTGRWVVFAKEPPAAAPWNLISLYQTERWNTMAHYDFFQNRECEYYPCHAGADPEQFSCLFCYCPLYALGDKCGGDFCYTENGIKDCSGCLRPHKRENYDAICKQMQAVIELAKKP